MHKIYAQGAFMMPISSECCHIKEICNMRKSNFIFEEIKYFCNMPL